MSDLLTRLRETPCNQEPFTASHARCQCRTANAAADRIERLELAMHQISGHGNITVARAKQIANEALQER